MNISDIISADAIIGELKVGSKKQLLQELSRHSENLIGIKERDVFDILLQRERLGSTGFGYGIAIPHGKIQDLDRIYGVFARLETPIDFESNDSQPVDLVFLLLAPECAGADHLKALARISRIMRNERIREDLRQTSDVDLIYSLLTIPDEELDAA